MDACGCARRFTDLLRGCGFEGMNGTISASRDCRCMGEFRCSEEGLRSNACGFWWIEQEIPDWFQACTGTTARRDGSCQMGAPGGAFSGHCWGLRSARNERRFEARIDPSLKLFVTSASSRKQSGPPDIVSTTGTAIGRVQKCHESV